MNASVENATPRPKRAATDGTSTAPPPILFEYEELNGEPVASFLERLRATAITVSGNSPMHTLYPSVTRV